MGDIEQEYQSLVESYNILVKDYQAINERLEWYKDKHRKALRHAKYCGDWWEYYEDRTDQLTIIADTLASHINEIL